MGHVARKSFILFIAGNMADNIAGVTLAQFLL